MEEPAVFKIYRYADCYYVEYSVNYASNPQCILEEVGGIPCGNPDQVLELIKAHLTKGLYICKHTEK